MQHIKDIIIPTIKLLLLVIILMFDHQINGNEEGVDFYILQCITEIEKFHSEVGDEKGNVLSKGFIFV